MVIVLSTSGAEGKHQWCEGWAPIVRTIKCLIKYC